MESSFLPVCCGLVMKEDITQPSIVVKPPDISCGLVMKEDITQREVAAFLSSSGCGLVMKEDITQHHSANNAKLQVVVW